MQIKLSNREECIDVISTLIIGDSTDYSVIYKTKYGDIRAEEVDTIVDDRNLLKTIAILETMINNNEYIEFNIEIKGKI